MKYNNLIILSDITLFGRHMRKRKLITFEKLNEQRSSKFCTSNWWVNIRSLKVHLFLLFVFLRKRWFLRTFEWRWFNAARWFDEFAAWRGLSLSIKDKSALCSFWSFLELVVLFFCFNNKKLRPLEVITN